MNIILHIDQLENMRLFDIYLFMTIISIVNGCQIYTSLKASCLGFTKLNLGPHSTIQNCMEKCKTDPNCVSFGMVEEENSEDCYISDGDGSTVFKDGTQVWMKKEMDITTICPCTTGCPEEFMGICHMIGCYHLEHAKTIWQDAKSACEGMGSQLITFNTKQVCQYCTYKLL